MEIKNYYIEKGQGDPMILLHGNSEDHKFFEHQIDLLAEKYHVYALDSRGHGKTPRGEAPLTIEQMAKDLNDFIESLDSEKVNIFGFSDGANIAMTYAVDHPDKIDKLILNAGNMYPEGMPERLVAAMVRKQQEVKEKMQDDLEAIDRYEKLTLMIEEPKLTPEDLKKIKSETLVIAGDEDMVLDEHTRLIADSIPNSRLEIIEGDHFIANKKPEEFNEILKDFLQI